MEIVETSVFTKQITQFVSDEGYQQLQRMLVVNPLWGALVRQSGGLRKIRWGIDSKGKSGGIRVIYYYVTTDSKIYMLVAYDKSKKDDLTQKELARLRKLVKAELS